MSQNIRQNPEFETDYRGKWHLQMQHWLEMKNGPLGPVFIDYLAEEAGFEPAVGLTLRTLSRRVT